MRFVLTVIIYGALFAASYFCMSWRNAVRNIWYGYTDMNSALLVSLVCPPIGVVFGLLEVAFTKIGWLPVYEDPRDKERYRR